MLFLVTGATGFIGREVARQLMEGGHRVAALVRHPERAGDLAAAGIELRPGDIVDAGSVRRAVEGVDGVFHLAAWYEVGRRNRRADEVNVAGAANVLQAAWDAGVDRIVHTSTVGVFSDTRGRVVDESYRHDGRHVTEYDRTKWRAHYEVAEPMARRGAPVVIVQPGAVYGPGDHSAVGRLIAGYLRGRLRYLPGGNAVCWGHVEDTARGHVLAMERGRIGESYIIAGPPHTIVEAFEIAERVTGIRPPRLRVPAGPVRALSRALTAGARLVPPLAAPAELTRLAGVTYLGDNAKARAELGFAPRSLEDGFAGMLPDMLRAVRGS
jgi:nucleoside-diphosphate-sugar epimerase